MESPQNLKYSLNEDNVPSEIPTDVISFLINLQHREMTPEDYDMLLRLDEGIAPKTVQADVLGNLKTDIIRVVTADGEECASCAVCMEQYEEDPSLVSREEVEYTTNELRNSVRSIEWDLEDLEETVNILVALPVQISSTLLMTAQDDHLDMIGSSVGVLKNMSHHIGNELEDQNVMLDDFRHDMDHTETRLDQTMKKMAKVMHMSNDRRQWCAIGVLLVVLILVIILFFVL
nr:hypothetical protein BaRGS_034635 [Batillaria attramentaria]